MSLATHGACGKTWKQRGNDDAAIGVVVHKKAGSQNPADQYVSMDLETFARLLEGGSPL